MPITNQIQKLWLEFQVSPFPKGYGGEEIDGIDLALLDGDIAGCVQTFIVNEGSLDTPRIQILRTCIDELAVVMQKLDGDALRYFKKIENLAILLLQELIK